MTLEWNGNFTTDGRFSIQGELIRGEPRYFWLVCTREADWAMKKTIRYRGREYDGSTDRRQVMRWAQRIADAVDAVADIPVGEPKP